MRDKPCNQLEEQLEDYLTGNLNGEEMIAFEETAKECPEIDVILKNHSRMDYLLVKHKEVSVSSKSDQLFYDFIESKKEKKAITINWWQLAASIALLIIGGVAGAYFMGNKADSNEISSLKEDVTQMKELLVKAMLEDQSAMERIKAVSYTETLMQPTQDVVEVLVKALDTDESPNVRIAAANALEQWGDYSIVRKSLVNSMDFQSDPIVQITLINILISIGERSAVKPFMKIIEDDSTQELVRKQAQIGIEVLI